MQRNAVFPLSSAPQKCAGGCGQGQDSVWRGHFIAEIPIWKSLLLRTLVFGGGLFRAVDTAVARAAGSVRQISTTRTELLLRC